MTGKLAICAIMKNEGRHIIEWIAYHRLIGVERFFLYDNNSTDNVLSLLHPLIEHGLVEYKRWSHNPGQVEAYADYAENHRYDFTWTAFIDLDEFIHYFGAYSLSDWLDRFGDAAGIALQWINFGPSGHATPPDDLTIRAFNRRLPDDCPVHGHVKTIVRTAAYRRAITPHAFEVEGVVVDEYGAPVTYRDGDYSIQPILDHQAICLNHYYTRSRSEWLEKVSRGMADSAAGAPNRRDPAWIEIYERDAIVEDSRLAQWEGAVRLEIERLFAPPARVQRPSWLGWLRQLRASR